MDRTASSARWGSTVPGRMVPGCAARPRGWDVERLRDLPHRPARKNAILGRRSVLLEVRVRRTLVGCHAVSIFECHVQSHYLLLHSSNSGSSDDSTPCVDRVDTADISQSSRHIPCAVHLEPWQKLDGERHAERACYFVGCVSVGHGSHDPNFNPMTSKHFQDAATRLW